MDANHVVVEQTRGYDQSVFLLGGFALENLIKALLVYENPHWISNGRLSGKLKSHSLTKLRAQSELIPRRRHYLRTLSAFEAGLDSWFRYPCALTIEDTKASDNLHHHVWEGYLEVICAYARKLTVLLNKGWNGPHGYYGRWIIRGQHFGRITPISERFRRFATGDQR
jgi:hypothetical protein